MKAFIYLSILILITSCNKEHKKSSIDKRANIHSSPKKIKFEWNELADTLKYSVAYMQLNFDNIPNGENTEDLSTALKKGNSNRHTNLTGQEQYQLSKFLNDSANFSNGECGTFNLNAGFIIYNDKIPVGEIKIGCGYNQWLFAPINKPSKEGSLSEKGFRNMEKLLDRISKKMN